MARDEEQLRRLRAALDGLAARDAAALLDAAREEARARVQATLADVLTESMLDHVLRAVAPGDAAARAPRRAVASADSTIAGARSPEARSQSSAEQVPAGVATYVYGVLADAEAGRVVPPAGIDADHPVRVLEHGELAALASSVPLADFDEHRLRERLSDMSWVEQVARRHEAVLESALRTATVVPMRMCTIFRDDDGVRAMLARDHDALWGALEGLAGKAEWGLKAFRSAPRAGRATDPVPPEAGPASGTGYLERQREARRRRERAGAALAEACDAVHRRLAAVSADAALLSLQRPEVSGHPGEMLLNAAYLVGDDRCEAFHDAVRAVEPAAQDVGIELVLTGPWPAYNFVPDAYRTPA